VAAARDHQFVPVRIDLSPGEDTEEKRAVLASYEQRGLPLVVFHDRAGNEVQRVTAFVEPAEFLQMMERVD
jgi:thiol:disulfide interchange protein